MFYYHFQAYNWHDFRETDLRATYHPLAFITNNEISARWSFTSCDQSSRYECLHSKDLASTSMKYSASQRIGINICQIKIHSASRRVTEILEYRQLFSKWQYSFNILPTFESKFHRAVKLSFTFPQFSRFERWYFAKQITEKEKDTLWKLLHL